MNSGHCGSHMYSVPPIRWLPVTTRETRSTVHRTPTTMMATAWLDSSRRLQPQIPTATRKTVRLQRKRKFAIP